MKSLLAALAVTVSLTGCATRWVVDSDVRSFSEIGTVPADATYRFERLPSQQYDEAAQLRLEAMAGPALEGVGLRRDDAAPHYTAQIGARVTAEASMWVDPYGSPWWGPGPWGAPGPWGPYHGGWGYGSGWSGPGWWGPPPYNPWYSREVSIVLRELPSNRVVYETRARNDGPYNDSGAILPVMFQAALQGFPNPPKGERRVNLEIPTTRN
ncbi:DUF4136 domain-containing protein [Variovorax ureilyticus]|uniref:DUF4136 domain-containing protein n=1 Tax=Variovorax ureilyticus TaxID=1836198 RepID=UPI003D66D5F2